MNSVGLRALLAARTARHRARRRRDSRRMARATVLEQRVFLRLMPALVQHVRGPTDIAYGPEELIAQLERLGQKLTLETLPAAA